jgi:hypothetical protein
MQAKTKKAYLVNYLLAIDHFIIRFAHFGLPVLERAIWTNLYHGIAQKT